MFGEVVSFVELSGGPEEIELALFDAVFHPPVAHVESFGEFLAHFGIEDAMRGFVVGFDRRAGRRLGMSEFCEGDSNGAGVFASSVDAASFGLGGRGDNIL